MDYYYKKMQICFRWWIHVNLYQFSGYRVVLNRCLSKLSSTCTIYLSITLYPVVLFCIKFSKLEYCKEAARSWLINGKGQQQWVSGVRQQRQWNHLLPETWGVRWARRTTEGCRHPGRCVPRGTRAPRAREGATALVPFTNCQRPGWRQFIHCLYLFLERHCSL